MVAYNFQGTNNERGNVIGPILGEGVDDSEVNPITKFPTKNSLQRGSQEIFAD